MRRLHLSRKPRKKTVPSTMKSLSKTHELLAQRSPYKTKTVQGSACPSSGGVCTTKEVAPGKESILGAINVSIAVPRSGGSFEQALERITQLGEYEVWDKGLANRSLHANCCSYTELLASSSVKMCPFAFLALLFSSRHVGFGCKGIWLTGNNLISLNSSRVTGHRFRLFACLVVTR